MRTRQLCLPSRTSDKSTLTRLRTRADGTDEKIIKNVSTEDQAKLFTSSVRELGWKRRLGAALPHRWDEIDSLIVKTALPSMINLAVVPMVNAVDTFWVGRMGIALALAGQAAANQAFFTIYFLVAFLPTLTAPMVAKAVGDGNQEQARKSISDAMFLCNILGAFGTILLVAFPKEGLKLVLDSNAPAMSYAVPYLRWRGLSMIPALLSATGFAAFRGLLDTITPLKVSLGTNLANLILDPLLIFATPLGVMGAALATAVSETASGFTYLAMLLRRKLTTWRGLIQPPAWNSLVPLIQGGLSVLGRQLALNVGFVTAARRAQAMDSTGVCAAAYAVTMQIYTVGIVLHVAMQGTAAALVPSTLAQSGVEKAREMADRLFAWNTLVGILIGTAQFALMPLLLPLFSTLPEVQHAARVPMLLTSLMHIFNGPVFAGEGVMLGLAKFRSLMLVTLMGIGSMVACLSTSMGSSLTGVLLSFLVFTLVQAVQLVVYYLNLSPFAAKRKTLP